MEGKTLSAAVPYFFRAYFFFTSTDCEIDGAHMHVVDNFLPLHDNTEIKYNNPMTFDPSNVSWKTEFFGVQQARLMKNINLVDGMVILRFLFGYISQLVKR